MARGRMLSKSWSTSAKRGQLFAVLGPPAESLIEFALALYPMLVAHADDFGREAGDIYTIKHAVDPASPRSVEEFDRVVRALAGVGLIRWYEVDGKRVVEIVDFDKHQIGLHNRTRSAFPDPPPEIGENVRETDARGKFPKIPESSGSSRLARARGTELNLTEQNRTKERKNAHGLRRAHARTTKTTTTNGETVRALAAVIRKERLALLTPNEGDLAEVVKHRAAQLGLPYTSALVVRAIASARAQRSKSLPPTGSP